jgi:hypothetical protein
MEKHPYIVTYEVAFANAAEAARLDDGAFEQALFSSLEAGHLLMVENDEDTGGVKPGDLVVIESHNTSPTAREYQVRHRLSLEHISGSDPAERVVALLAEALGVPQQEGSRWWIREFHLRPEPVETR